MKISIGNNISYKEIEAAYKTISSTINTDLYIPSTLTSKQMGIYSEIIQLVITWNRISTGKLYINYDQSTVDLNQKIDVMFRRYWNFVAASMGYKKGIFLSDNTDITKFVGSIIKDRVDFLNIHESWKKGDSTFISSIQHSAKPYPYSFYLSNGTLKSKKEFIELSKNILVDISKNYHKNTSTKFIDDNKQLIGEIIFELIENTHFWSQENYNGSSYDTGIKGLLTSVHRGNEETLLKNCKDDYPFIDFIQGAFKKHDSTDNIFILEISVFDSGSGIASKYLKKDIKEFNNYNEIYNTIIDCLIKGNTSDNYSAYERGFGLHNIMKLLSDIGFLKIRTNGLKLFRNFIKTPFIFNEEDTKKEDYNLDNWHAVQDFQQPNYRTEGTLFSIFIPLKAN